MSPANLAHMLQVQFVGDTRPGMRSHPDVQVSVVRLREAFRWLAENAWPFMEMTMHHECWEANLDPTLEDLLQQYIASTGFATGGVPAELAQGASQIPTDRSKVLSSGPADCVPKEGEDVVPAQDEDETSVAYQSAGIIDGGVDDATPVQIWDQNMKKYKVAQMCEDEIERLEKSLTRRTNTYYQQRQALAVAAAVEALNSLHSKDIQIKLHTFLQEDHAWTVFDNTAFRYLPAQPRSIVLVLLLRALVSAG